MRMLAEIAISLTVNFYVVDVASFSTNSGYLSLSLSAVSSDISRRKKFSLEFFDATANLSVNNVRTLGNLTNDVTLVKIVSELEFTTPRFGIYCPS